MIIDARTDRGLLVNADTGETIRWARRADLETGAYEAFAIDPRLVRERRIPLTQAVYRGRARLRWLPAVVLPAPSPRPATEVTRPAPVPPPTPSGRRAERCLVLQDRPCQHYACARWAEYAVSDEQLIEPEVGPDGRKYERGETVRIRYYCPWHYKLPRQVDSRDEIIREIVVATQPGW